MNLIELLTLYKIPIKQGGEHRHVTANFIGFDCPYCSKQSGKFKLGYNLQTGFTSCWTCGPIRLVSALADITGESVHVLQSHLETIERIALPSVQHRGQLKLPSSLGPLLKVHKKYLSERGFNPDQLEKLWGVRGIGIAARLSWRIWIPICFGGEVLSWTTRSVADDPKLRYINAKPSEERVEAKSLLFGHDYVRNSIIVCEGPFDAMRIGPGAVATMGLGVTKKQVKKISMFPRRFLCFDNQEIAQQRARKLCAELSVFPGETFNLQIDAKDPASASKKEINQIRKLLQ